MNQRHCRNALKPESRQDEAIAIAAKAKAVLMLDADLSTTLTLQMAEEIAHRSGKEIIIVVNELDRLSRPHYHHT